MAGPTVGKLKALQVIGSTPNWKQVAWLTKHETYFTNMCFLNELSHIGRDSFPSARVHKGWVSNYNSISAQVGACRPISWVADWYARTQSVCSASWVSPVEQPNVKLLALFLFSEIEIMLSNIGFWIWKPKPCMMCNISDYQPFQEFNITITQGSNLQI